MSQITCFISILVKLDKNPQISWPQVWCCITILLKIMSTITNSWPTNSWRVVRNDTMKISWPWPEISCPWPNSFHDGGWPLKKKVFKNEVGGLQKVWIHDQNNEMATLKKIHRDGHEIIQNYNELHDDGHETFHDGGCEFHGVWKVDFSDGRSSLAF